MCYFACSSRGSEREEEMFSSLFALLHLSHTRTHNEIFWMTFRYNSNCTYSTKNVWHQGRYRKSAWKFSNRLFDRPPNPQSIRACQHANHLICHFCMLVGEWRANTQLNVMYKLFKSAMSEQLGMGMHAHRQTHTHFIYAKTEMMNKRTTAICLDAH